MKKNHNFLFIACSVLMLLMPQIITGQIIADHSIVNDYDNIPQQYIDSVKKMRLIIAGESHSAAYRDGLEKLAEINTNYPLFLENWGDPEPYRETHLRASGMTWGDVDNSSGWVYSYGEEDWFTSAAAISQTKAGITHCYENDLTMSAFGLGWCWDSHIDADAMDAYLSATRDYMNYCTANNIPTTILFTTGPVDGYNDEAGYNNYLRWQKVRDYVDTIPSAVLFDYADILCWDDNGVQTTETWDGHTFSNISPNSLLGDGTGHIGMNGAIRIAKAMWWMLARTAGWEGVTNTSEVVMHSDENALAIYPNPATDFTNISVNSINNEQYTIKIQDLTGKIVYQTDQYIGAHSIEVPTETLKPGMYYVSLSGNSSIFDTEKLIIIK